LLNELYFIYYIINDLRPNLIKLKQQNNNAELFIFYDISNVIAFIYDKQFSKDDNDINILYINLG